MVEGNPKDTTPLTTALSVWPESSQNITHFLHYTPTLFATFGMRILIIGNEEGPSETTTACEKAEEIMRASGAVSSDAKTAYEDVSKQLGDGRLSPIQLVAHTQKDFETWYPSPYGYEENDLADDELWSSNEEEEVEAGPSGQSQRTADPPAGHTGTSASDLGVTVRASFSDTRRGSSESLTQSLYGELSDDSGKGKGKATATAKGAGAKGKGKGKGSDNAV